MSSGIITPNPVGDLGKFIRFLQAKKPFSFVRFSDGEVEILRNRYLEINSGRTFFRGRVFKNDFPAFDSKKFDPCFHQGIRKDLLSSALFRNENFYKGIPTSHNNAIKDREFLLRLNGGFEHNMTFSDLFLNSNYRKYRDELVPLFANYDDIYVIANYRAKFSETLFGATHISIPDDFFANYDEVLQVVYGKIKSIKKGSLILSSASSLSNILAHKLFLQRQDLMFLDIGTSINDLLSLSHSTRAYQKQDESFFKKFFYKNSKGYEIKW